jgi:hypothetical protein
MDESNSFIRILKMIKYIRQKSFGKAMEIVDYDQIRENLKKDPSYKGSKHDNGEGKPGKGFNDGNFERKPHRPKKSKIGLIVALVAIAFLFAMVRPAVIGYSVYNNVKESGLATDDYSLNVENLNARLIESEANLNSCMEQKSGLESELGQKDSEIDSVNDNLDEAVQESEEKSAEINDLSDRNKDLEASLASEKENYEELLRNSARSICCKEKVDNENIGYYTVTDGKIECSEEEGEELDCW